MVDRGQEAAARGYDVFISHAQTDRVVARTLAPELSAAGLLVFLDELNVAYGEDFAASTTEALATARAVVVLAPGEQGFGASPRIEIQYAQARGRLGRALVIPVASTEAQLPAPGSEREGSPAHNR